MYCGNCGAPSSPSNNFCPACGQKSNGTIRETPTTASPVSANTRTLPTMKWFIFWTYVCLPITAIQALLGSFVLSGTNWQTGAVGIFVSAFWISIIYGLHSRRAWGWWLNWLSVAAFIPAFAMFDINVPVEEPSAAEEAAKYTIRTVIALGVWVLPNFIYWRKRRALFSNASHSRAADNSTAET